MLRDGDPHIDEALVNRAIVVLRDNIRAVRTVSDWARETGCSRVRFYYCIKKSFGQEPKVVLRDYRYIKIMQVILNNHGASSEYVANEVGLKSSQGLYKFLATHFDTTFSKFRAELLSQYYQKRLHPGSLLNKWEKT